MRLRATPVVDVDERGVVQPAPAPGCNSVRIDPDADETFYEAVGYPVVAGRAVRADMLERIDGRCAAARRGDGRAPWPQVMSSAD